MRIRVKFSKNECVKFLGHLDIMRSFQRCFIRCGVKMIYSEGYSPHQKMTFALPLGVGITSKSEYMDAEIEDGQDTQVILEALQKNIGPGFDVYSVTELHENAEKCMSTVKSATYTAQVIEGDVPDASLFSKSSEVFAVKKTKSGEKEIDIKPLVYSLVQEGPRFTMTLSAGNENNLKAELVLETLYRLSGIPYERWNVKIERTALMAENMIPLEKYQTVLSDEV